MIKKTARNDHLNSGHGTVGISAFTILLLMCFSLFLPATLRAETTDSGYSTPDVTLYYFWSRYCPHCKEAKPFINQLVKRYSWLQLKSYDLVGNKKNQRLYVDMASQIGQPANSVPAFIYCGQMQLGYDNADTTGKELETNLLDCWQHKQGGLQQQRERFNLPGLGSMHYQDYSLPVFTLLIAALDAFNPCAFFILFFLLSLMVNQRRRLRMLLIGGTFVLCSGLMYFLFMTAWLNLFLLTKQLMLITAIAGVIAVLFGLVNIKDYFYFKQGVSLSLSDSARENLFARMRRLIQGENVLAMMLATVVLAIAANSYELLCTAGFPMIYTRVLTLSELSTTQYYLYLLFYNLIYIVPLMLIVLLFTLTLGRKKLTESQGRVLKLLSGSMMTGLGVVLLIKPEMLSNMLVSVAVIGFAIVLTVFVVLLQKLKSPE